MPRSAAQSLSIRWPAAVVTLALAVPVSSPPASAVLTGRPGVDVARLVLGGGDNPHPVPAAVHSLRVPAVPVSARDDAAAEQPALSALAADEHTHAAGPTGALVARLRSPVEGGFSLLGVTWQRGVDPQALTVVTRSRGQGGWSEWTPLPIDPDEGPAPAEEPAVREGTAPLYVADADAVEVAVYSTTGTAPEELRVAAIDPGESTYDATAATAATSTTATTSSDPAPDDFPSRPAIVTRRQWGADPSLGDRCFEPRFGTTFKAVFVHHTAGSNDYSRAEAPAVVRGVYAYHTQSRGWCDIGYNFLVDRYGTVYEGRAGGIRKPVRGAHAGDYNVNSTGISLMGTFSEVGPTRAMKRALVRLTAWRLGTAYHDGRGYANINGHRFKRISGHRDAMSTSCPGERVYAWLPVLRDRVASRLDYFMSPIKRRWQYLGGGNSVVGTVRVGETIERGGRHTTYQDGRMYSFDGPVRTFVASPLLRRYVRSGEIYGVLGYPVSRVRGPRNGLAADFEGGSIYWSERTKSRVLVRSAIRRRYFAENGALGPLGFPLSGVRRFDGGARAQFEHGTITFLRSTGRTRVDYS